MIKTHRYCETNILRLDTKNLRRNHYQSVSNLNKANINRKTTRPKKEVQLFTKVVRFKISVSIPISSLATSCVNWAHFTLNLVFFWFSSVSCCRICFFSILSFKHCSLSGIFKIWPCNFKMFNITYCFNPVVIFWKKFTWKSQLLNISWNIQNLSKMFIQFSNERKDYRLRHSWEYSFKFVLQSTEIFQFWNYMNNKLDIINLFF